MRIHFIERRMADDSLFLIDIDKILREKAPKQSKYIPKFVISYLKRIIHQEELNVFLRDSKDRVGVDFLQACLDFLDAKIVVKGEENLPKEGLCTLVSNHPLGGVDGVALGYVLGTFYKGKVKYMVNDLLMNLEPLRPIFVPVNKHGKQGAQAAQAHDAMYRSTDDIITFPAGLCSRLIEGQITDPPWRKTFVQKALRYGRPIVPVYIDGTNSRTFYRVARWRKRLRIGANLEMVLLPKEMFDQRGRHITIYIGAPIVVDASRSADEWAHEIRQKCYELRNQRTL